MDNKFSAATANLFNSFYSPEKLFSKIGNVAKSAGIKAIYATLLLYYALFDGDVPIKDKALVVGALGYFILPTDLIPDFFPGGFTDDYGALLLAIKSIWDNLTPNTHSKARERLNNWFSDVKSSDLKLF